MVEGHESRGESQNQVGTFRCFPARDSQPETLYLNRFAALARPTRLGNQRLPYTFEDLH